MTTDDRAGLIRLFQEAKDVLSSQVFAARRIEDKASHLLQFGALVAGLVIAAAGQIGLGHSWSPSRLLLAFVLFLGIGLHLVSILACFRAYSASTYLVGLSGPTWVGLVDAGVTEAEFLQGSIRAYAQAYKANMETLATKSAMLGTAVRGMTLGLAFVAVGSGGLMTLG